MSKLTTEVFCRVRADRRMTLMRSGMPPPHPPPQAEEASSWRIGMTRPRLRDPVEGTSRITSARRATPATCWRCATPRSTSRAASCSA